jgi:hypothetical protein
MRARTPLQFLKNNGGSSTIEFVVVFLAFIAIMFFVVEVTLYMFFLASLEKAAEAGVRAAAVSAPVVNNVDLTNDPANNSVRFGTPCRPGNCQAEPLRGCGPDWQPCSGAVFDNVILPQMQRFNGQITANNVGITYRYTGIGFAGGPAAPMVTATIECVPFQVGLLGLLLGNDGGNGGNGCSGVRALPPRSASMTGEDLRSP